MNVGPIATSIPSMPMVEGQNVNAATSTGDANGGNKEIQQNNTNIVEENKELEGGAPSPLKQMSTSDFLTLHEMSQGDSVMDKLEKIFETILALKLLEDTVENITKSIEEQTSEGE
tara:strand:+ start:259 stop:606 length:348 start_codon:yes stop_codon:yes gene_type:complete